MALAHYIGYIENTSTGKPLPSVVVLVYSAAGGVLQPVFADLSGTAKPLVESDDDGGYDFYIADGNYDIEHVYNGVVRNRISNIAIFNPDNYAAGGDLSGTGGAALVGTANGDTVQEYLDSIDSRLSEVSVGTFVEAQLAVVPVTVGRLVTTGRNSAGDGGAATYVRWAAPMAALIANQEGYSWYETPDGARWTLIAEQTFVPQMFGAMGDPNLTLTSIAQGMTIGTDDRLAIQRALDAPMVKTLLVTKQHWFGDDIRKPSGKHLQGIGRAICGFHRIPLVGNQVTTKFGVFCQDDDAGSFSDFFVNCQRSGWNPAVSEADTQHLNNRCSGLIVRRDSRNVRVTRVDVYNSWGYSHYSASGPEGDAGPAPVGTIREDCRAYNGDTCFETTGLGSEETLINCWGYRNPIDGGNLVYMECAFHTYSGVKFIHRIRCGFIGSAPAVLDAIANGLDSELIINENCYFQTTGGQFAFSVLNPDPAGAGLPANVGKRIKDYRIINCRVVPDLVFTGGASPQAIFCTDVNLQVDGGTFGGTGIQAGPGSVVKIKNGPTITGSRPSGGPAVWCLNTDGSGTIEWFGKEGKLKATHPTPGLGIIAGANVTFHDYPLDVDPPFDLGVLGNEAPRIIQRLRGYKLEGPSGITDFINAGGNVYWASTTLGAIPTGWTSSHQNTDFDKVTVSASLEREGLAGVTAPPLATIQYYRRPAVSVPEVFFTIKTDAALPAGTRLRYDIIEEA